MHDWCNDDNCPDRDAHEDRAVYEGMFEGMNEEQRHDFP